MRPSIRISESNVKIGHTPSSAFKAYVKPAPLTDLQNLTEVKSQKRHCVII